MRSTSDSVEAWQLDRLVMLVSTKAAAGESIDLDELTRDCPEHREQLEMLLPTLEAMAQLGHNPASAETPDLQPPAGAAVAEATSRLQPSPSGVLGDFRILRELGRGGMGVVYEAEQLSIGRRVALKVLPFAAMLDKQQLNRFKNEARAAGTLDHPNIVQVYSVGVERGVHYYAMQLIEGESLAQVIARLRKERGARGEERGVRNAECGVRNEDPDATAAHNSALITPHSAFDTQPIAALSTLHAPRSSPLAPSSREYFRTIARLGVQAAEALDHAHQNGILHRDVKPANLMVEYGDCPLLRSPASNTSRSKRGLSPSPEDDAYAPKLWITDFGLARLESDAGMTMTGDLIGTLRYMSPEQALAKRVVVDHRSDVYSLGATLYELLTLRPPFDGDDRQELLRQIAFDEPKKPRQLNSRIPPDMETIVLKALEKNPADRFATSGELADDLRRFLVSQPIKARPATPLQRVLKWSRRHIAFVWSVIAVLSLSTLILTASSLRIAKWYHQAELSAHRAGQAAAESRAVVDFLVNDLLAAPLDEHKLNRELTVSEVLANAEAKIGSGLADQPLVEATVRHAMAKSYETLQKFEQAEPHVRRALELRTQLLGPTHHETLECTTTMMQVLLGLGRRDEARRLTQDAFDATRRELSLHHADTIESMNRVIFVILRGNPPDQSDIDYATILCDEALSLAEQFLGPEHPQTLRAASQKAFLLFSTGKYDDSEALWQRTLATGRRVLGPNDDLVLKIAENLALIRAERQELRDSVTALEEVLIRSRKELGNQDHRLISPMLNLSMRLVDLARWSDARELCDEALEISVHTYGAEHPTTIECKQFLADVIRGINVDDEACRLQRDVLEWRRRHLGTEHPKTIEAMAGLAYNLALVSRLDESLDLVNETIEIARRILPQCSAELCSALDTKSLVLEAQGKIHEARLTIDARREMERQLRGHNDAWTYGSAGRTWRVLMLDGAVEEAKEFLEDAVTRLPPNEWIARNSIAWHLITSPYPEARDASLAMVLVTRACELTDYKAATCLDTLAAVYAENGDFDSAVKWCEQAIELATARQRDKYLQHLESFKNKNPWREEFSRRSDDVR